MAKMSHGVKTLRKQGAQKKRQNVIRGKTALVQTHPLRFRRGTLVGLWRQWLGSALFQPHCHFQPSRISWTVFASPASCLRLHNNSFVSADLPSPKFKPSCNAFSSIHAADIDSVKQSAGTCSAFGFGRYNFPLLTLPRNLRNDSTRVMVIPASCSPLDVFTVSTKIHRSHRPWPEPLHACGNRQRVGPQTVSLVGSPGLWLHPPISLLSKPFHLSPIRPKFRCHPTVYMIRCAPRTLVQNHSFLFMVSVSFSHGVWLRVWLLTTS